MFRFKLCVFASLLFAATGTFAADWTDLKQIKSVQVMNQGGFIIHLDEDKTTICTENDTGTILFYPNHNGVTYEGAKSLLSSALIALSTGNKVNIMYSFSIDSGYCWGNTILLTNLKP